MERAGVRPGFFYLRLCDGEPVAPAAHGQLFGIGTRGVDDLVAAYGISRLLCDIDESRAFDERTIVAVVYRWIAREGFAATMTRYGFDTFSSARAYRERHLIAALSRGL